MAPGFSSFAVSFLAEIARRDLGLVMPFYLGLLRPLGFRRDHADENKIVWLRRDEKIVLQRHEGPPFGALGLRLASPEDLDAHVARLREIGAETFEPAGDRYRPAGWKGVGLRDPEGGEVTLAYWHDALPEVDGAERVDVPGAGLKLGGYLARPKGAGPFPAVCVLHWYGGSALTALTTAKRLAEAGYVGLALSMRGFLGSEGLHDQGDRQSDDVVEAMRWLAARPEVDAGRLGLIGYSLGSQVGQMGIAKGAPVRAFVGYFGAGDLNRWRESSGSGTRLFFEDIGPPEHLKKLSPITHVAKSDIPVLLIHGTADRQMPHEQSELLAAALRRAGRSVELRLVPGADHLFTAEERASTLAWAIEFFDKTIR